MNFNTSLYSNALKGISHEFGVSEQGARCGAMIFLVTYVHRRLKVLVDPEHVATTSAFNTFYPYFRCF